MLKFDEMGFIIPPKGGTKVASYIRERDRTAHILSDQPGRIYYYALENGFEHVATFEDTGMSESDVVRPGLEASLAAAAASEFEILIVTSFDRLARRLEHLTELRRRFGAMGVVVIETSRRTFASQVRR